MSNTDISEKIAKTHLQYKSLYSIYINSPSCFESSENKNIFKYLFLLTLMVYVLDLLLELLLNLSIFSSYSAISSIISSSEVGSLILLGFLITGLSIFSSISKPRLLVELALTPHYDHRNISSLQYLFFSIISSIVNVSIFYIFCVLYEAFISPISKNIYLLIISTGKEYMIPAKILHSVFGLIILSWVFIIIIKIKSFIYNIYSYVMLSVVLSSDSEHIE